MRHYVRRAPCRKPRRRYYHYAHVRSTHYQPLSKRVWLHTVNLELLEPRLHRFAGVLIRVRVSGSGSSGSMQVRRERAAKIQDRHGHELLAPVVWRREEWSNYGGSGGRERSRGTFLAEDIQVRLGASGVALEACDKAQLSETVVGQGAQADNLTPQKGQRAGVRA